MANHPEKSVTVTLTAQAMSRILVNLVYLHLFIFDALMRPSPIEHELIVIGIICITKQLSLPRPYPNVTWTHSSVFSPFPFLLPAMCSCIPASNKIYLEWLLYAKHWRKQAWSLPYKLLFYLRKQWINSKSEIEFTVVNEIIGVEEAYSVALFRKGLCEKTKYGDSKRSQCFSVLWLTLRPVILSFTKVILSILGNLDHHPWLPLPTVVHASSVLITLFIVKESYRLEMFTTII